MIKPWKYRIIRKKFCIDILYDFFDRFSAEFHEL